MKRNTLETAVLVLGLAIMGAALFFIFFAKTSAQSIFLTNIIFSIGFLVYIIYSMMTSNSLNRDIRGLNSHVAALKKELSEKKQLLEERQKRIDLLESEKKELEESLSEANEKIASLEQQNSELRASQKNAKP